MAVVSIMCEESENLRGGGSILARSKTNDIARKDFLVRVLLCHFQSQSAKPCLHNKQRKIYQQ